MILAGVRKRYGRGPWVLDGIDLELAPGELGLVVGGNGSGKSTLLRIAAGAALPTRGTVRRPPAVAYVPERLPETTRMTPRTYLGHLARIRRAPAGRAAELLERFGVADLPIGALSKGNRQKVALAQAFLAPVGLLVLDEPGSGLDVPAAAVLDDLLAAARETAAVLVSAHTAGRAADHTWSLTGGQLAEPAAPAIWLEFTHVDAPLAGADYDPAARTLRIRTEDPDPVLRHALDRGWRLRRAG